MNKEKIAEALAKLLAESYVLALKTQNYHWHVKGEHFYSLHNLFEEQYDELNDCIDEIAERIRMLGFASPATFKEFLALSGIAEGDSSKDAKAMLNDLSQSHETLAKTANNLAKIAGDNDDAVSAGIADERKAAHDKAVWFLKSIIA